MSSLYYNRFVPVAILLFSTSSSLPLSYITSLLALMTAHTHTQHPGWLADQASYQLAFSFSSLPKKTAAKANESESWEGGGGGNRKLLAVLMDTEGRRKKEEKRRKKEREKKRRLHLDKELARNHYRNKTLSCKTSSDFRSDIIFRSFRAFFLSLLSAGCTFFTFNLASRR